MGALTIQWDRKLMRPDNFAEKNLNCLQHAASMISAKLGGRQRTAVAGALNQA